MRIVMFYHSLVSDWNHGNAHFLRGLMAELQARGHAVTVYEPADGWSAANLRAEYGEAPFAEFRAAFPALTSVTFDPATLDLAKALHDAELVLVHEWNAPALVQAIGAVRAQTNRFCLLFHDTHHRAVTAPESMAAYDLRHFDGVLAFGRVLRELYLERGWARQAWTWHEAADTRVFKPLRQPLRQPVGQTLVCPDPADRLKSVPPGEPQGDLVWIGNWGDDERAAELQEFLIEPVRALKLRARVYGVRYPEHAQRRLREAGIEYAGWLPNYAAPQVYARFRVTVHVPRRPYAEALPGIPTIRVFEALACGIPLISAPWEDSEQLFTPGRDYLCARTGHELQEHLHTLLHHEAKARALAAHGLETIRTRHTCAHRVDELLRIYAESRQ
jgi:spore maturation protein CgeB